MKLSQYLTSVKLTQWKLAKIINCKQNTISQWVSGVRTPSPKIIKKIHEVTNGLVTYADWIPDATTDKAKDIAVIKKILKEKRIKLQNVADYLGFSGSRLSQKFTDNSFSDSEKAKMLYYINHVNPITGEIIDKPVSESRGYIKFNRNINVLIEHQLKPAEFTLLSIIALRANKSNTALIGDYAKFGLTQKEYISAKKKLEKIGWCEFTGIPQKGTIAKLLPNPLFQS